MSDHLRSRPSSTRAMLSLFDDSATIGHALAFEGALARAECAEGLIAPEIAAAIQAGCGNIGIDALALAEEAALAGTLAIPFVKRLRAFVGSEAGKAVHMGATSQDLADTVLMLQMKKAEMLLAGDLERIRAALHVLAERHSGTPAIARTLLQDATPIGFGLRLAQASCGIEDAGHRLRCEVHDNARIQLGGAAGTRAGLDGKGASVAKRMAWHLDLEPSDPWHARRVGIGAVASALGIVIGSLGKLARDVSLLAQNAIAEAREPVVAGRGGSSAMAHKRNPTGCQIALSAAIRAPGLVASILAGMTQEEERGLGGWQAEGPVLADLFLLAAGSVEAMVIVAEGLEIDEAAIARNLATADVGSDIGESREIVAALLAHPRKPH